MMWFGLEKCKAVIRFCLVSMEHNPEMEQSIELLLIYGLPDKVDQHLMDCYGWFGMICFWF